MQDFAHYQLLTRGFIYKARYFSFDGRKTLSCITGKKKQKKRQQIGWKKPAPVGPLKTRTLLNGYTTWQKANSEKDMGVMRHIIV